MRWKKIGIIYFLTFLLLAAVKFICLAKGIETKMVMRDPIPLLRGAIYVGCVSNLGILAWGYAASVFFFAGAQSRVRGLSVFLFWSGVLTALLTLDDFFLLHEKVIPLLFGIPEKITHIFYGILTLIYLVIFRENILKSYLTILLPAFFFFAVSLILDDFIHSAPPMLEDGAKLFGVVTWAFYAHCAGAQAIQASPERG